MAKLDRALFSMIQYCKIIVWRKFLHQKLCLANAVRCMYDTCWECHRWKSFATHRMFAKACTPPTLSKISLKNWRAQLKPFLTCHSWYKVMLKSMKRIVGGICEGRCMQISYILAYFQPIWLQSMKWAVWLCSIRTCHGQRTPNEGINQRNLKNWANVAEKICFGRT